MTERRQVAAVDTSSLKLSHHSKLSLRLLRSRLCIYWSSVELRLSHRSKLCLHLLRLILCICRGLRRPRVSQKHRSEHLLVCLQNNDSVLSSRHDQDQHDICKTLKIWYIGLPYNLVTCVIFYKCEFCGLLFCPCLVFLPWPPWNLQAENRAGLRLRMSKAR